MCEEKLINGTDIKSSRLIVSHFGQSTWAYYTIDIASVSSAKSNGTYKKILILEFSVSHASMIIQNLELVKFIMTLAVEDRE